MSDHKETTLNILSQVDDMVGNIIASGEATDADLQLDKEVKESIEWVNSQANDVTKPNEKALPMCSVINWVAVADRLPEEEWGDYMICLDNNAVFKANYSRIGTERWLIVGVGTLQKTNPVKYWAELPEPPCL